MLGLRERDDYKTQIVFIRHCESFGNVGLATPEGFHPDDPPLTDNGLEQAKKLTACFEEGEIAHIYASPLTRTVQTVYPTAQKLGMKIELLPDLMETNTHIGGCARKMLERDFPLAVPCTNEPTPTGGSLLLPEKESPEMLAARAKRCIDYIRKKFSNGETVIVVSHGTFFGYLIRECLDIGVDETFNWEVDNCSATCVVLRKDGKKPLLRTANSTKHLY